MTESFELGEMTTQLARLIRRRSRQLPLAPHQHRALRIIAHQPIRPAQLADALSVTPRAITDVADALVEQGLISVGADPTDRRAKLLTISPRGAEYLESTRAARAQIASELFGTLSPDEREQLGALLQRVLAAAENYMAPRGPGRR